VRWNGLEKRVRLWLHPCADPDVAGNPLAGLWDRAPIPYSFPLNPPARTTEPAARASHPTSYSSSGPGAGLPPKKGLRLVNRSLQTWVDETARITKPERVVWCDGSPEESTRLLEEMVQRKTMLALKTEKYPDCYFHRSHPSDVARTEHLTFICSRNKEDAGPTNHWMAPDEAKATGGTLCE